MKAKNYWWWFFYVINHMLFNIYKKCLDIVYKFRWRNRNKHNVTELKHFTDINKITVWNYTLWRLDVRLSPVENSYVKIWSYCCIAPEVEFLCLSNHPTDRLTLERVCAYYKPSWQFKLLYAQKWWWCNVDKDSYKKLQAVHLEKMKKTCKWPIIVDDDVRIWTWAKIMSWVHIWQWAVIAAGSIVTKDIPPYAIAWWVPAKVIKYRFTDEKIKKLLKINFSEISMEQLFDIYPETIKENFDMDNILLHLWK